MSSERIVINQLAQIHLILEAKIGDDPQGLIFFGFRPVNKDFDFSFAEILKSFSWNLSPKIYLSRNSFSSIACSLSPPFTLQLLF